MVWFSFSGTRIPHFVFSPTRDTERSCNGAPLKDQVKIILFFRTGKGYLEDVEHILLSLPRDDRILFLYPSDELVLESG